MQGIIAAMYRAGWMFWLIALVSAATTSSGAEFDLPALAKKARPAVVLLEVFDAAGKNIASGTGFFVSEDGKLITNSHVIKGATTMTAKAENGAFYKVEGILAEDKEQDLAVLQVQASDVPALKLGSSAKMETGMHIAVIGSPLGLEGTLSEGILSARRETEGARLLQISAPISPGSSGSPVLNADGEVVGVARGNLKKGQALNLAVPAEAAELLLTRISLRPKPLDPQIAQQRGLDAENPKSTPLYDKFATAADAKKFTEALKYANELVARYPRSADMLIMRARVLEHLNSNGVDFNDEVIADLKKAIALAPDNTMAWVDLSRAYILERPEDALKAAKQAIKTDPASALTWRIYGYVMCAVDPPLGGEKALLHALELDEDEVAYSYLAERYTDAGRTQSARRIRERLKSFLKAR